MKYIYKNEVNRPINIGGYSFNVGQELPSNIIIERFKEAVSNGFLSLREADKALPTEETEAARKAEEAQLAEEARKAEEKRLKKRGKRS